MSFVFLPLRVFIPAASTHCYLLVKTSTKAQGKSLTKVRLCGVVTKAKSGQKKTAADAAVQVKEVIECYQ